MSINAPVGRITVTDVEELNLAVSPWDLLMRQSSPGAVRATLDYAQIQGLLLTRESWSHSVLAMGTPPPGYVILAGPATGPAFRYCGTEISEDRVAFGVDAPEIDFVTPDKSDHWVVLVPISELNACLDDESCLRKLQSERVLRCPPGMIRRVARRVDGLLEAARSMPGLLADGKCSALMASDLLDDIASLVMQASGRNQRRDATQRQRAYRRAVSLAGERSSPMSVSDLAVEVGVSTRTLERAFRERLAISPRRYLHLHLLNRLRRALRSARPDKTTVTSEAIRLGFTELGRMAGTYRALFDESPSETLAGHRQMPDRRFGDVLRSTSTPAAK